MTRSKAKPYTRHLAKWEIDIFNTDRKGVLNKFKSQEITKQPFTAANRMYKKLRQKEISHLHVTEIVCKVRRIESIPWPWEERHAISKD